MRQSQVISLCILILCSAIVSNSIAQDELESLQWRRWGAPAMVNGSRWSAANLWHYGMARVFHKDVDISIDCPDCNRFAIEATPNDADGGIFGVEMRWGAPMEQGNAYRFIQTFANERVLPDVIAVNGRVVWKRAEGFASDHEVHYVYVPTDPQEEIFICLFWTVRDKARATDLFHQWHMPGLTAEKAAYRGERPDWPTLAVPDDVVWTAREPTQTARMLHDEYLVDTPYDRPAFVVPDRPVDDVVIFQRVILPFEAGPDALRAGGVKTLNFQPRSPNRIGSNFQHWAEAARAAGVENITVTPVYSVKEHFDDSLPADTYQFEHQYGLYKQQEANPWRFVKERLPDERAEFIDAVAGTVGGLLSRWHEMSPDGDLYSFWVEFNGSFADYAKGSISEVPLGELPGYEHLSECPKREVYQAMFDFFQRHRRLTEAAMGEDAARLKVVANFDNVAFQIAYAMHCGVDIAVSKCIHRQSINIAVANARGAARAYGKEYGFDFDSWNRQYWMSYPNEPIRHGLMSAYHGGGRYLMNEINIADHNERLTLTKHAPMWFDFCRYVKAHPPRGVSQSRIAIMRALGDSWNQVASESSDYASGRDLPVAEIQRFLAGKPNAIPSLWSKVAARDIERLRKDFWQVKDTMIEDDDLYYADFDMLDLVFADYGNHYTTGMDRLCTGTPYGPIDFIPWDTPPEVLNQYDLVAYLGRGIGSLPEEHANLQAYVEQGGTLLMAAGQLRDDRDRLLARSFCGIGIKGTGTCQDMPFAKLHLPEGSYVLASLPNGQPSIIQAQHGRGTVYLAAGEWLSYWDQQAARSAMQEALEGAKWLDLSPASSWIEYNVLRKNGCWIVPVMNHGRGLYPSGNGTDHGTWQGKLTLDLTKFSLLDDEVSAWRVVYSPENVDEPFALVPVEVSRKGDTATIRLDVADVEELVIGPPDAEKHFWE